MIDKKDILHISKLARLEITDDEAQKFSEQLGKAVSHFSQIAKLNTEGVVPMTTPTEIESFWREDQVEKNFSAEDMVKNAPAKNGNLFKVPPVV